jgi:hypothetical protein
VGHILRHIIHGGGTTLISLGNIINPPQIKEELHMRHHLIKPHSSHSIIDTIIGRDHEGLYEND